MIEGYRAHPATRSLGAMDLEAIELRIVALPMVEPFATAHGLIDRRTLVVVRLIGSGLEGWGECAALPEPTYTHEYVDGAFEVLAEVLAPRLLHEANALGGAGDSSDTNAVGLRPFDPSLFDPRLFDPRAMIGRVGAGVDAPMALAALELALLDLDCRRRGQSLAARLVTEGVPATSVVAGAAIGVQTSPGALAERVAALAERGYGRLKVKITPGRDVEYLRAARAAAGDSMLLMADANGAYRLDPGDEPERDVRRLAALEDLDLICLEQPLPAEDLVGHRHVAELLATPICLDESIRSVELARRALDLGACAMVCVKAPMIGGWLDAVDLLDDCHRRRVPTWIGGMIDGGIGRAANLALAAHPAASIPGDLAASDHYFPVDITPPIELRRPTGADPTSAGPARLTVPTSAGVEVDLDRLEALTTRTVRVTRGR